MRRHFAYSLKHRGKNQFYSCQFSGKRQSICWGSSCGDIFSTQFIFPRVIFGMVYLLSFLSLLQIIQFCLDASLFWNLWKLNGGSVEPHEKQHYAIRILLMFSYSMHMGIFPSWRNSSKSFLKYYQQYTGLPSACNCRLFPRQGNAPKKNSTCKDWPRNIKQPWNIPRKRGNTMEKNMKPECSGGLLWEISEYKAPIVLYLGYENPSKMFHHNFLQWWGW